MSKETIPQSIIDKINAMYRDQGGIPDYTVTYATIAKIERNAAEWGYGLSEERIKELEERTLDANKTLLFLQDANEKLQNRIKELEQKNKKWEQSFELYLKALMRGTEKYRVLHPDFPRLSDPDTGEMIEDLCNRIAELEASDKWISVKDGLPEVDKWLLLYNGHWTGVGKYKPNPKNADEPAWRDETSAYIYPEPTHYQYLPKPPKNI